VLKLDGRGVVTLAMHEFPDNVSLQCWGCSLFKNISQWEAFKDPIIRAGGIEVLVAAIRKHNISYARSALQKLL
jgi:hypothetical protein